MYIFILAILFISVIIWVGFTLGGKKEENQVKRYVSEIPNKKNGRFLSRLFELHDLSSYLTAPPSIDVPEEMKNIVVKRGDPAEISLPVSGSPPPEVKWTKDGVPVKPDERIQELTMPDSATLLVTNTGLADGGEYEVEVINKHGSVKEKVNVVIIGKLNCVYLADFFMVLHDYSTIVKGYSQIIALSLYGIIFFINK